MGLSAREKEGCRSVLKQLDSSDLLSLYQTVLKTTTNIRIRAALIDAILEHSQSAAELLNRKKVYKEIILNYLNKQNLFMHMKSTKFEVVQKAIEHWQEPNNPITVNVNAVAHLTISGLKQDTSEFNLSQLFNRLSINGNSNQEDQPPASQPAMRGASSPKTPPQKTQKASHPEEGSNPSASTSTGHHDAYDKSSSTADKGVLLPKKSAQQTQKAHQPEESSKLSTQPKVSGNSSANTTGALSSKKSPQKKQKASQSDERSTFSVSNTSFQPDASDKSSATVDKGVSSAKKPHQKTLKVHHLEESSKPSTQPEVSGKSTNTPSRSALLSKKSAQKGRKVHQTEERSKPPASTTTGQSDAGATVSMSQSQSCPQRSVKIINPKQKATSEKPPVTSVAFTVTVSTSVLQQKTCDSQDSSVQGTRAKKQ